jgi:hypothetical protein
MSFHQFWDFRQRQKRGVRSWCRVSLLVFACGIFLAGRTEAQVAAEGSRGAGFLSAGATGSWSYLQYGQRSLAGPAVFVDADTTRRFGIEAEGRWLDFHQSANEHAETYSVGVRYHWGWRRFEPYAKGMVGFANFNYPYNYAHGRYLTVTAGGGVDYPLSQRFALRAIDFEWQDWPQFTFASMNTATASAGFRVRVF